MDLQGFGLHVRPPPLLVPPGAQAEVSADQVADVVWKSFTQLSSNAKETVDQLQQSEVSQQLQ